MQDRRRGENAPGRVPLSRDQIVRAAIELIDERGVRELSMRALGQRLGVEGMALYRHVPSRDNLLDAIVERVLDDLYGDPDVHLSPHEGWQDYLSRIAHGLRRLALQHPQVFPLIATRPPAAPWIRPPLRSLRWIDAFLAGLAGEGFDDSSTVYAYRAFSSFLLGHLLLEVSALGVDTGPADEPDPATPTLAGSDSLATYPSVQRLAPALAENRFTEEFEESLANLLERLELERSGQPPPRRTA